MEKQFLFHDTYDNIGSDSEDEDDRVIVFESQSDLWNLSGQQHDTLMTHDTLKTTPNILTQLETIQGGCNSKPTQFIVHYRHTDKSQLS